MSWKPFLRNRDNSVRGGLPNIPERLELERAYSILLHRYPASAKETELALFSQWSRFDPRLAEIWVSFLVQEWERLNPIELRKAVLQQPWPAAAAVLLEFAGKKVPHNMSSLFHSWSRIVTENIPKGNCEQFFIGLRRLGGQAMQDDARFAFSEYRKWGYLGREILINKGGRVPAAGTTRAPPTHTILAETRREILKDMLTTSSRVTTDLYWEAIGRCLSRRQAERDLRNSSLLKKCGNTRARYFLKR